VAIPSRNISSMATESLTTDLSRMRGMLVIGRNPAFAY
jgi:hypothetical protein